MAAKTKKELTPKQLLFIDKYFELQLYGTEAYLQTYTRVKKRTTAQAAASRMLLNVMVAERVKKRVTAQVNASRLLSNAMVSEEVERRKREMREASKTIVDRIREELEHLAFARIGNYLSFGPEGITLKSSKDMTPEQLAASRLLLNVMVSEEVERRKREMREAISS